MRKQDYIFLAFTLGAMVVGVFMPFLAEPLRWFPKIAMLSLLFLCFLTIDGHAVWENITQYPTAILFAVTLKLVILPVICWLLFQWILPQYALGAAIIGGCATAVSAPFFAYVVLADHALVLVSVVSTSLLLPFVLPAILALLGSFAAIEGGIVVDMPVFSMIANLAFMTAGPFALAQIVRRNKMVTEYILSWKQSAFLVGTSGSNVAIFAQYSSVILQTPQTMLVALSASFLVFAVLFLVPAVLLCKLPPEKHLAFVISCVAINNVLALITCLEYFSLNEVLLSAMYSVPFFFALVFYRLLGRIRNHL
ncbi:MAG: hypothetical protein DELT_00735 [Desulfovibrio sp.]